MINHTNELGLNEVEVLRKISGGGLPCPDDDKVDRIDAIMAGVNTHPIFDTTSDEEGMVLDEDEHHEDTHVFVDTSGGDRSLLEELSDK
jgi:hypothetical protein